LREHFASPLVIDSSLLSAIATAARWPFIEFRNRFGVLPSLVLYDEFQFLVISVNRKLGTTAAFSWITAQEIESVVTTCLLFEHQVAKADYIIFVSATHTVNC